MTPRAPHDARAVAEALRAGRVAVIPTDTVYGLAADARNTSAINRLFELKGRPADNPIPILVADLDTACSCAAHWPPEADRLAQAFWPGPLTIVVDAAPWISTTLTAGTGRIGLRQPAHEDALDVLRCLAGPLACTSANRSGEPPAAAVDDLPDEFRAADVSLFDAGRLPPSPASTVVECRDRSLNVLREGALDADTLQRALAMPN